MQPKSVTWEPCFTEIFFYAAGNYQANAAECVNIKISDYIYIPECENIKISDYIYIPECENIKISDYIYIPECENIKISDYIYIPRVAFVFNIGLGSENSPRPASLTATTRNSYSSPSVRLGMMAHNSRGGTIPTYIHTLYISSDLHTYIIHIF